MLERLPLSTRGDGDKKGLTFPPEQRGNKRGLVVLCPALDLKSFEGKRTEGCNES